MPDPRGTITKDTLIPIGGLLVLLAGVFWLSTMFATVNDTQRRVADLEPKVDALVERTARIEAMLESLSSESFTLQTALNLEE